MDKTDIKLSKALSWLLRHGATKSGIAMNKDGFVHLDLVLALPKFKSFSADDVKRVVGSNDKQRFSMKESNGQLLIRANQGHSLEMVVDVEMEEISRVEQLPQNTVVHGTYCSRWSSIQSSGLNRMSRNHIHFAVAAPRDSACASAVISGMRSDCDLMIYIDVARCLQDGIKFYRSVNQVILSPGDKEGIIGAQYFSKVVKLGKKNTNAAEEIVFSND